MATHEVGLNEIDLDQMVRQLLNPQSCDRMFPCQHDIELNKPNENHHPIQIDHREFGLNY